MLKKTAHSLSICHISKSNKMAKIKLLLQPFHTPQTLSGTTQVSRYQKGKPNLDLLEQEIVRAVASAGTYAKMHLAPNR